LFKTTPCNEYSCAQNVGISLANLAPLRHDLIRGTQMAPEAARCEMAGEIKKTPSQTERPYVPTEREVAAIQKFAHAERAPRVRVSEQGKAQTIIADHPDEATGYVLLMEALGTSEPDFLDGLLSQLANAGSSGRELEKRGINFMLSVIKGIKPRDQVEAMLAAQMAAVHMASMTFARRLGHVENIPQQDSAERAFNKLTRTFATQMEALKRYRTGGEQKVTVQHVRVSEGGQAIVGNVTHTSRGAPLENAAISPPAITDANSPLMPIIDGTKEPVRVTGRRRSK